MIEPVLAESHRSTRIAILIACLALYSAGAWQAWRSSVPPHHRLPKDVAVLSEIATSTQDTTVRDLHCNPKIHLSLVHFVHPTPRHDDAAPSSLTHAPLAEILHPGLRALQPLLNVDFTVELKPLLLDIPSRVSKSDPDDMHYVIPSHQAATLAHRLQDQLPSSTHPTWRALVLTPPLNEARGALRFEIASNDQNSHGQQRATAASSSLAVSSGTLLVVADNGTHAAARGVAHHVLSWLLEGLPISNKEFDAKNFDGAAVARHVAGMCLQSAAAELKNFLKLVAKPEAPVTAAMSEDASEAVHAFRAAERAMVNETIEAQVALQAARSAYSSAEFLSHHPDLAIQPKLPAEHVLALLLPIALPIGLAIVQGVGKEVKAAKSKSTRAHKERRRKEDGSISSRGDAL